MEPLYTPNQREILKALFPVEFPEFERLLSVRFEDPNQDNETRIQELAILLNIPTTLAWYTKLFDGVEAALDAKVGIRRLCMVFDAALGQSLTQRVKDGRITFRETDEDEKRLEQLIKQKLAEGRNVIE